MREKKPIVQEAMYEVIAQYQSLSGRPFIYRELSRAFIEQLHEAVLQQKAATPQTLNTPQEFDLWYDAAYGIKHVATVLAQAEKAHSLSSHLHIPGLGVPTTEQLTARQHLENDPSGFSLLTHDLTHFQLSSAFPTANKEIAWYSIPDYVVAGAYMGAAVYRELYTTAQETFPQQQAS